MEKNRWLILLSSFMINICIGSGYAWSVFQKPLIDIFKWTASEASLTFTITFVFVPIAMIVSGKLQDKIGPRKVIMVGALIFGCGIIGAGFTSSLLSLYMTYGVLGGFGNGIVYSAVIANTVKWFPDRRGLASGLIVAGFGTGAIVVAPIAAEMIQGYGVLNTLLYLGICFAILMLVLAQFLHVAPAGFTPAGWAPPAVTATSTSKVSEEDKNWRQMLIEPMFCILFFMLTIACISGLMVIGHASSIGQELIKLTVREAAVVVSFLAMANTIGRVFWGWISDKIGRFQSCMIMYILLSTTMFCIGSTSTFGTFVTAVMVVGFCFGGFLGIFPSITADMFGTKNLGMNYGIMFTGFGLAALIGPRLAAKIKEINSGDYTQAFLIAASLCIVGVLLTFVAMCIEKRKALALVKG